MAKVLSRNGNGPRYAQASKYDARRTVLSKTYGALADLRRELADLHRPPSVNVKSC